MQARWRVGQQPEKDFADGSRIAECGVLVGREFSGGRVVYDGKAVRAAVKLPSRRLQSAYTEYLGEGMRSRRAAAVRNPSSKSKLCATSTVPAMDANASR